MPTLTLISHHLCPYVQRVAITLAEKNVPCERVNIDLNNKPDWFLRLSPLGKVPLLRLESGEVLFESAVICEYLEDTLPPALHPASALERARHRAWIELASAVLADIWGYETATDAETLQRKAGDLRAKFLRVEAALDRGPYFAGAHFSLVDAAFAPAFRYFEVFDEIFDHGIFADLPKTQAWRTALAQRPSVRAAVPADYHDRLRAFLKAKGAYLHRLAA